MNELAKSEGMMVAEPQGIVLRGMQDVADFAQKVVASRLAPQGLQTPEAVFIAISMGLELGLQPMQALQSIAVINGRPVLWGDACLALVKASPECEDVIESIDGKGDDGTTATCTVKRKGKADVTRKFTKKMAETAKLWAKPGPWSQYPMRMLQMRARSWALRDSFPDVLKGIGVREEVQDYAPARAHEVRPQRALILPGGETIAPQIEDAPTEPVETLEEPRETGDEPAETLSPGQMPCDEEGRLL